MRHIQAYRNRPKESTIMFKHMRSQKNQQGIVSIVITIILMLVITLIVLSFAQISRREQRNALDRQLSTQAFYAAESGVNYAKAVLEGWIADNDPKLNIDYMTACTGVGSFDAAVPAISLPVTLSGSGAASYTCVFVDPSVPEARFAVSDSQKVLPIQLRGGGAVGSLEIYWDDGTPGMDFSVCPAPPNNPSSLTNCNAPVLRLEIVAATDLTASKVFFIYPSALSGGALDYATSSTGTTGQGNCSGAGSYEECKLTVSGLGGSQYYIRLKGIYKSMAFTVKPLAGEFVGLQAIIDVTGKATDVERRIQVRLPINNLSNNVPLFGLEGTDKICKKFSISGGGNALDEGSCWADADTPD